jgi:hypothetical protein
LSFCETQNDCADAESETNEQADGIEATWEDFAKPDCGNIENCAQNEYWESQVCECLRHPCCDLNGDWTFIFNDMSSFPWKPIVFSANIQQSEAFLKFRLNGAGKPSDAHIPKMMSGLLEKETLHLDGENAHGFLTLDATKIKEQFATEKIEGEYSWLINDGSTMTGTFYLQH